MKNPRYIDGKKYKPLALDYEIPYFLEGEIDLYMKDLNENGGTSNDCFSEEIYFYIKWCTMLTEEQRQSLRDYYCKGGIFDD